MMRYIRKAVSVVLAVTLLICAPGVRADHVVTPSDLQKAVEDVSKTRAENLAKVEGFLTSEPAVQAMKKLNVDPVKITRAVPTLSDEELARIAAQANQAQANFAAGMGDRDLIYLLIVVLLVIAIVIIVANAVD